LDFHSYFMYHYFVQDYQSFYTDFAITDLFSLGNAQRILDGKKIMNQTLFLQSKATQGFIQIIAKELNININKIVFAKGRGKSSKTYAQLHFLIYAAEKLSPMFHFHVIDVFLSKHLLQLRDDGGNVFKTLNFPRSQRLRWECIPRRTSVKQYLLKFLHLVIQEYFMSHNASALMTAFPTKQFNTIKLRDIYWNPNLQIWIIRTIKYFQI